MENEVKVNPLHQVRWYVMRAYKCEAFAEECLEKAVGIQYFIPKQYKVQSYHGKKIRRLVPVIPSLVFVHATRAEILAFKKTHNFLQFAMWKKSTGTKFITVPEHEMQSFISIASQIEEDIVYYAPGEIQIKPNSRVRIHGGSFDGVEGHFQRVVGSRARRLVVLLDGVLGISAEVSPDFVEVLSE